MYFSCIDQSAFLTGTVYFIPQFDTHYSGFSLSIWNWADELHLIMCICPFHSPYVIGTMNQGVSSSPNLELHHNFRYCVQCQHSRWFWTRRTASDDCYSSFSPHGGHKWSYFTFVTCTHTHIQYTNLSSHVLSVISDHQPLRWVLCANHTEPVKGFLGRFLKRKLIETEIDKNMRSNDLIKIIDWIPKTWQHLNSFLEAHSSSDVTIGNKHNTQAN